MAGTLEWTCQAPLSARAARAAPNISRQVRDEVGAAPLLLLHELVEP